MLAPWPCVALCVVHTYHRSHLIYRARFNLAGNHGDLVDLVAPPAAHAAPGGPFALAWRAYLKSVFKRGFMYKLSCKPSVILYIAENKTLAGKEDRSYEGEALGRKMAIVFFEEQDEGLVRRVNRETQAMNQELLSIAELLQTVGGVHLPADPARTAAQTEVLLESHYEDLEILRYSGVIEPASHDTHVYTLENEVNAEVALAQELSDDHRTKMVLVRCLQRQGEFLDDETLQTTWNQSLVSLKGRTSHLFPAAPAAPAAPPAPGAGRGRGRARGGGPALAAAPPPAGRGRGRGRGLAVAPAAPAAPPAGRGRARGRGRG